MYMYMSICICTYIDFVKYNDVYIRSSKEHSKIIKIYIYSQSNKPK